MNPYSVNNATFSDSFNLNLKVEYMDINDNKAAYNDTLYLISFCSFVISMQKRKFVCVIPSFTFNFAFVFTVNQINVA